MTYTIAGAGIGGLTLAIALNKNENEAKVYEQAPDLKPVGAGIVLASNAMQVYQKLGLQGQIEASGHLIHQMNITRQDLTPISKVPLKHLEQKYGVRAVAIHRGILQQILANSIDRNAIGLSKKINRIEQNDTDVLLDFEDGSSHSTDVLIGADGIHSTIRNHLFPSTQIRKAYQKCWRAVVNFSLPDQYHHQLFEAWGPGSRFGFGRIDRNHVYWYALKSIGKQEDPLFKESPAPYFDDYHPLIQELMNSTPQEAVHTDGIFDLKPIKRWINGNVCLIGDAAHATTPNMGQGACQAIEDAYVLAGCLQRLPVQKAFEAYNTHRRKKAHMVVNMSWSLGKIAHLSHPLLMSIRNMSMRMMPASLNQIQTDKIFRLTLPWS